MDPVVAPTAPAEPVVPAAADSVVPAGTVSPATIPVPTPAHSAPTPEQVEENRVRAAQQKMHEATALAAERARQVADLEAKLKELVAAPPTGQAPQAPPPYVPSSPPPVGLPPVLANLAPPAEVIPQAAIDTFMPQYQAAGDDKAAVHMLVNFVGREVWKKVLQSPELYELTYQSTTGRAGREARQASEQKQRADAITAQVHDFWKSSAPQIPTRFIESFSTEAAQRHPYDLKSRALYCLERAMAEWPGGVPAATSPSPTVPQQATPSAIPSSAQQVMLTPGGAAMPPVGSGATIRSFVEQARANLARPPG